MLICREGTIAGIQRRSRALPRDSIIVDAKGGYISPGFVDLHVHGGAGADFMDGTAEAVDTVCRAHARHGTTTIFPTTTTGSCDQILSMLDACKKVMQSDSQSTIAGVHLYGPFFAPEKVGCHSAAGRRSPTTAEYKRYFASQIVAIATCAAELPGATAFYRAAAKAGCLITCGHSNASWTEMQRAFDAGM